MKLIGKNYEYRGCNSQPDYKDSTKTIYNVLLEDGVSSTSAPFYVSSEIYHKCESLRKGQICDVVFEYNSQYRSVRLSDVILPKA